MSKTVMIVEDNALNMKLFADLLESEGYEVERCVDGQTALKYMGDCVETNHFPDVIIMDIQLPHMSGLEVVSHIRANDQIPQIPIVAVTAYAMRGDEERIRQSGIDDYMSKPISIDRFLECVGRYSAQSQSNSRTKSDL